MAYWDSLLFNWINGHLGNPVFDLILPLFREKLIWAPLYVFVFAFSLLNWGRRGWIVLLGILFCVLLADTVSSKIMKPTFARTRPCREMSLNNSIVRRVDCGPGYSFTSSHASNHFAIAVFLIGVFGHLSRKIKYFALAWAALIAFSQVYVGVHYPMDVFVGALLGIASGRLVLQVFRKTKLIPLSGQS